MHIAIIYCHPSEKSHNARIRDAVLSAIKEKKDTTVDLIDLYTEKFDPSLKKIEYERAFIDRDRTLESDVQAYQERIAKADYILCIYPIWWYAMPARLKGFFDRVMTGGFAFRYKKTNTFTRFAANILSYIPGLRNIAQSFSSIGLLKGKKAIIIRTYGGPAFGRRIFNNVQKELENAVLKFAGIKTIGVYELFGCNTAQFTPETEQRFLDRVSRKMEQLGSH